VSALFDARVEALRAVLTAGGPPPPVWLADQARAAQNDALGRLFPVAGAALLAGSLTTRASAMDGGSPAAIALHAVLVAAAVDCVPCPHLRRASGPMPAFVALNLHRVSCERCLHTFRHPPADEADRCDVCGSRGNSTFRPFTVAAAHMVFMGDAGLCCFDRLGFRPTPGGVQ
jgi:hypothetical protein